VPLPLQPRPRPRVVVVLAAGKGTRMNSPLPKVLHRAAGRPLLEWVLRAAVAAAVERILVVVGYGAEEVKETVGRAFRDLGKGGEIGWVLQAEQKGTGHALAQAEEPLGGAPATLLVLSGDVPLVTPATLERLARSLEGGSWGALATAEPDDPGALGRVVARPGAERAEALERIVEARDATPAELAIRRINAGLYALPAPEIFAYLRRLTTHNAQGELYLTDALNLAAAEGNEIRLLPLADPREALGVNDRAELAQAEARLRDRGAADAR